MLSGPLKQEDADILLFAENANPVGSLSDAQILVVDDSPIMRSIIAGHLRNEGFNNIHCAGDGEEALAMMAEFQPELVITDLLMPNMDGFALCNRLRAGDDTATIPILVQTGSHDSEDRARVFSIGATDLLTKPINRSELIGRVRVHLDRQRLIGRLTEYQRRMARELELARLMQRSLLPRRDDLAVVERELGLQIAATYEASDELAGDLWGMEMLGPGRLRLYAADFTGHGVSAALNTFRLHSVIHKGSDHHDDAASWLNRLNAFLCDVLPTGQFATMFSAIIDINAGTLQYSSAAAPPPMLRHARSPAVQMLDAADLPLGITRMASYSNHVVPFEIASSLIVYSDVLIETPAPPENIFDTEGLRAFIEQSSPNASAYAMLDHIYAPFFNAANAHPADDLTLLVVQRGKLDSRSIGGGMS